MVDKAKRKKRTKTHQAKAIKKEREERKGQNRTRPLQTGLDWNSAAQRSTEA